MCTFKFECVRSRLNSKNHVCTCTFVGQRHNQEHPQSNKKLDEGRNPVLDISKSLFALRFPVKRTIFTKPSLENEPQT